jgi:hypothetical protein
LGTNTPLDRDDGLDTFVNDPRRRWGIFFFLSLNPRQRMDPITKAAKAAVTHPQFEYMDCAQHVAARYDIRIVEIDNVRIKKAISWLASTLRMMNSMVDLGKSSNEVMFPTSSSTVSFHSDRSRTTALRGKGRHRCSGKKRK